MAQCFFCGSFLLFVFRVCRVSFLLIVALWSLAGKGLTSCLSCVCLYCVFVTFPCVARSQVWCLIVSISDLCLLSHLENIAYKLKRAKKKSKKCVSSYN